MNRELLDEIYLSDESLQFKQLAVLRSLPKQYKIIHQPGAATVTVLSRHHRRDRRTFPAAFYDRIRKMETKFSNEKKARKEQKG